MTSEKTPKLLTRREYNKMLAYQQGYAQYWQGEQPGSELKNLHNPYPLGSKNGLAWKDGQMRAASDAQVMAANKIDINGERLIGFRMGVDAAESRVRRFIADGAKDE